MDITGERLQVIERVPRAQVAGAEDVLDLSRNQKFLELGREAGCSVRDVDVPDHQHELQKINPLLHPS